MTLIASNALVSLALLGALLFLVYGPWQWVCTDCARQIIFEKRDEIFNIAADGDLSFKSDEYRIIRSSLETSIRFAHDLTLQKFIVMGVRRELSIMKDHGSGDAAVKSGLLAAVDGIKDEETREKVKHKVYEATLALATMVVLKSPLATLIALPLLLCGIGAVYFIERCRHHAMAVLIWCGELIQVGAENSPASFIPSRQRARS